MLSSVTTTLYSFLQMRTLGIGKFASNVVHSGRARNQAMQPGSRARSHVSSIYPCLDWTCSIMITTEMIPDQGGVVEGEKLFLTSHFQIIIVLQNS